MLAVRCIFQSAALLDMARVCRNGGVGDAQEMFSNDSSHLQAIEMLPFYLRQDPYQCVLELLRSNSAKEHYLDFWRHEKEVPSRGMDLAIEGEAVQHLDHVPGP
jgi:hypothetical protein